MLDAGKPARDTEIAEDEEKPFRELQLLTSKPALYVCNVDEEHAASGNEMTEQVAEYAKARGAVSVVISAEIESQLAQLEEAEQVEYLESLGLHEPGLNRLIVAGYQLLGLITYFTAGPKEARAWTITKGTKAPAGGRGLSTPTSNAASFAPRPSPMTITWPSAAKPPPRRLARHATKARNMSCRTATSSCSSSTPDPCSVIGKNMKVHAFRACTFCLSRCRSALQNPVCRRRREAANCLEQL